MKRQHLFDREHIARRTPTTKSLVPVSLDACPTCAGSLATETVHEDALLRHGGHGATRTTTRLICDCGWSLTADITETRPPRPVP